jgi:hypothetical protein
MSDTREQRIIAAIQRHPEWDDYRIACAVKMPRGQNVTRTEVAAQRVKALGVKATADRHPSKLEQIRMRLAEESKFDALRKQIRELERDRDELLSEFNDVLNARPVQRSYDVPKTQPSDWVRVSMGDLHGMRQDKAAVAAFLHDMKVLQPNEFVILGDVVDCGGFLAKHQTLGFVAECDYTYREDIAAANDFLDRLQAACPNAVIHFIMGNHDDRVERWCVDQVMAKGRDAELLMSVYGPVAMLRLAERNIKVYRRDEIYGEGLPRGWLRLGKMFFTHDLGYSVNAARAAVLKAGGNVTFGHSHRWDTSSVVFPSVGVCAAFNPGCLCLMQPMYMHSKPTDWTQGYDIDFVSASGNFLRTHVPIWKGESLAGAMVERFKS